MEHKGTMQLLTRRLILRPARLSDAQAMYENWAKDPEVTTFLTWQPHASAEVSRSILESWVDAYGRSDYYQWMIVLKEGDEPIGSISVVSINETVSSAEIGYCIGKHWWHRGYTSEALGAVMDYLFDEVGVNRIEARHDVRNPNSGGVMRKCGMKFEGTHRQGARNNQGLCDVSVYAIVAEDRGK